MSLTKDHAGNAGVEGGLDFFGAAHASAQFARHRNRSTNFADGIEVGRLAGEGGIEVHEVEPIRAIGLPFFREGHWVGGIHGLFGGEAAAEADHLAAHEVDGGQ
jgi:hypothetical protein